MACAAQGASGVAETWGPRDLGFYCPPGLAGSWRDYDGSKSEARGADYGRHRPGRRLSAEYLLGLGYTVTASSGGRPRSTPRASIISTRIRIPGNVPFLLHYGDMTDSTNLIRLMQQIRPTEIYNLAAQSHVGVSFESPEYTANADAIGVLRLLEAIRILGMEKETRFYQASTSELYGLVQEVPQKEPRRSTRARLTASPSCTATGSR
jgi:GDP-mannose 4,6-dehydratase